MSNSPKSNNTDLALKLVLYTAVAVVLAFLFYRVRALLCSIIIALTLASAMAPVVEFAEKRKIPRLVTVLAIYITAGLSYILLAASLATTIRDQWNAIQDNFPVYLQAVSTWLSNTFGFDIVQFHPDVGDIQNLSLNAFRQTLNMTAGFFGLILNAILIAFLAAYFVVEADLIWAALLKWSPPKSREHISALIRPLSIRMGGYVRGQLLVAIGVALFFIIGFSLIGIPNALLLGLLGGFCNLIPYIGSLIACLFALLVAFNKAPLLAGAVLLLYAVEQWIESSFMVPLFLGKHVELHPLIVLLSIIVGATLMGVPGALISVPLTSAIMLLAEEFYLKRIENQN